MPPKGKMKLRVTPAMLKKLEELAARGLDHEELAASIGINIRTFYDHKAKNPLFEQAIRRGSIKIRTRLQNALVRRALWDWKNNAPPNAVSHAAQVYIETHRFKGDKLEEPEVPELADVMQDAERLRKAALDAQARLAKA